jgi:hypothetical protein
VAPRTAGARTPVRRSSEAVGAIFVSWMLAAARTWPRIRRRCTRAEKPLLTRFQPSISRAKGCILNTPAADQQPTLPGSPPSTRMEQRSTAFCLFVFQPQSGCLNREGGSPKSASAHPTHVGASRPASRYHGRRVRFAKLLNRSKSTVRLGLRNIGCQAG